MTLSLLITLTSFIYVSSSQCYVQRTNWQGYTFDEPIGRCHIGPWGYGSIYTCIEPGNKIQHTQRVNEDCTGSLNTYTDVSDGETDGDNNQWVIKCTPGCESTYSPTTAEPSITPTQPSMEPTTAEPTSPSIEPTTTEPTIPSAAPTMTPTAGYWTRTWGNGADDCQTFESQQDEASIDTICTQSGDYYGYDRMMGIAVGFTDGTDSDFAGSQLRGEYECYSVARGECFTSVNLKYEYGMVGSLQFGTSDNQMTPLWGDDGDYSDSASYGNDYCIYKMYVCAGFNFDVIQFYFAPKVSLAPTMEPTKEPTKIPSDVTMDPSSSPSIGPTMTTANPTNSPTRQTIEPSQSPTKEPTEISVAPTASPTSGILTDWYGVGVGGSCTSIFEAGGYGEYEYINKICVRSGAALDGIQVYYTDNTTSEWMGGNGGGYDCYSMNEDECFSSVTIRSGSWIDAVQFHTYDNESTPIWGGNGGGESVIDYGDDYCISIIDTCSGGLVERMRFHFSPKVTRSPTLEPSGITDSPSMDIVKSPSMEPTMVPIFRDGEQGNDAFEIRYICKLGILLISLFYFLC